ncbi:hypothetical protein [Gibbsiella quercinecans]|uniref:hypothetical protein n=1 Tax=Gibbsiella quercinecans TaxID=929813 RepID=UPI0014051075|nr:hypothetical protein [Gibbsiella quercinecans]
MENALAKLLVTTWSKVKLTMREAAHYRHCGVNGAVVSFLNNDYPAWVFTQADFLLILD